MTRTNNAASRPSMGLFRLADFLHYLRPNLQNFRVIRRELRRSVAVEIRFSRSTRVFGWVLLSEQRSQTRKRQSVRRRQTRCFEQAAERVFLDSPLHVL